MKSPNLKSKMKTLDNCFYVVSALQLLSMSVKLFIVKALDIFNIYLLFIHFLSTFILT